jgi:hypothetical protein
VAVGALVGEVVTGGPKPAHTTGPIQSGSAQISGTRPGPAPTPAPTHAPH